MNICNEKRIKYLDNLFSKISKLNENINILAELKCVKFNREFKNFKIIFKILKLINVYKHSIRNEIVNNLNNDISYLQNFENKKLIPTLKINKTCITNNYKFNLSNNEKFILLKKEINNLINNMDKINKIKLKYIIVDFKKYCSDYSDRIINNYSIIRMEKYKIQLKYI